LCIGCSAAELDSGDLPSLDFLEYLGALAERDGDWLGPEELDGEEYAKLLGGAAEHPPVQHAPDIEVRYE
jgi:hypothetical protein